MKPSLLFITVLLIYVMTSSLTCCKDFDGDSMLDSSRSWVPLKGKKQLTFLDENGVPETFELHVVDTIEDRISRCSLYRSEFINATLYLNSLKTDTIFLNLEAPNFLLLKASSNNQSNIIVSNILQETKQGLVEKGTNTTLGNRTYSETILTLPSQGYSRTIDSVYIAKNSGVIGFKYLNKKFFLQ